MTQSRSIVKPRKHWTPAEDALLRARYPHELSQRLADELGVTLPQIYGRAYSLGLKKSAAFHASADSGRLQGHQGGSSRFKKGHVPANKGLRRPGWAPGNMAKTQFKKGRPASEARNYAPIGSHRISKDGYLERKTTDDPNIYPSRRWVPVHRLVWAEANGPIPAGHIVVFKKGQRTSREEEITPDRLECITLAENMRRNSCHNYGPEVASVIQLRGAISRQINKQEGKKAA